MRTERGVQCSKRCRVHLVVVVWFAIVGRPEDKQTLNHVKYPCYIHKFYSSRYTFQLIFHFRIANTYYLIFMYPVQFLYSFCTKSFQCLHVVGFFCSCQELKEYVFLRINQHFEKFTFRTLNQLQIRHHICICICIYIRFRVQPT